MINSITYRDSIGSDDIIVMQDFSPTDWIGEIVKIPHPNSGHMGPSMGEVIGSKTSTGKQRIHPDLRDTSDEKYKEVEYAILTIKDILTGRQDTIHQLGYPRAALIESGSTYSVYGIEQQTDSGEWKHIPFRNGECWGYNQFAVKSEMEAITQPGQPTRVVEQTATYTRKDDADPADATAYILSKTTEPIEVESPRSTTTSQTTS